MSLDASRVSLVISSAAAAAAAGAAVEMWALPLAYQLDRLSDHQIVHATQTTVDQVQWVGLGLLAGGAALGVLALHHWIREGREREGE